MSARSTAAQHPFSRLQPFADKRAGVVSAVIETPKGSRNKFDFDPVSGLFYLGGVLPVGAVFPFDFGFIPGTLGDDGDPLDILVLLDDGARSFSGCLVAARLLGAIEAEQTEKDGKSERNDRLIGVAAESRNYHDWQTLDDVPGNLIEEIEHFFKSYNSAKGKKFRPLARVGPARAHKLVKAGKRSARR